MIDIIPVYERILMTKVPMSFDQVYVWSTATAAILKSLLKAKKYPLTSVMLKLGFWVELCPLCEQMLG